MKKDDIMPEDKDNLRVITKVTKMNYLIKMYQSEKWKN